MMTPEMHRALLTVGHPLTFGDGDVLREKGTFAPDLILILSGQVDCMLSQDESVHLAVGPGTIVGEIGFLTGEAATATLRAVGLVEALSLDARALQRLQQETPKVASDVLRYLAQLLQERSSQNRSLLADQLGEESKSITVARCSTLDQMRTAQRVHYDVHCLGNGLDSKHADHDEGIIQRDLDRKGTTFIAYTGVQAIGMMRVHSGADCSEALRRIHGPSITDTCAVITTTAIQVAFKTSSTIGDFINAIKTYASATGSRALYVRCDIEQEAVYTQHGFLRTGDEGNDRTVSMILRV